MARLITSKLRTRLQKNSAINFAKFAGQQDLVSWNFYCQIFNLKMEPPESGEGLQGGIANASDANTLQPPFKEGAGSSGQQETGQIGGDLKSVSNEATPRISEIMLTGVGTNHRKQAYLKFPGISFEGKEWHAGYSISVNGEEITLCTAIAKKPAIESDAAYFDYAVLHVMIEKSSYCRFLNDEGMVQVMKSIKENSIEMNFNTQSKSYAIQLKIVLEGLTPEEIDNKASKRMDIIMREWAEDGAVRKRKTRQIQSSEDDSDSVESIAPRKKAVAAQRRQKPRLATRTEKNTKQLVQASRKSKRVLGMPSTPVCEIANEEDSEDSSIEGLRTRNRELEKQLLQFKETARGSKTRNAPAPPKIEEALDANVNLSQMMKMYEETSANRKNSSTVEHRESGSFDYCEAVKEIGNQRRMDKYMEMMFEMMKKVIH